MEPKCSIPEKYLRFNQPGVRIVKIDPVVALNTASFAPADFLLSYGMQDGGVLLNQVAIQYVGAEKAFRGGDSFGAILTIVAPAGSASSSAVFALPANDPGRFVSALPPNLNLLVSKLGKTLNAETAADDPGTTVIQGPKGDAPSSPQAR